MSCVTCRYCVTPAAAATIGECPSTCDIAKAISAWEAALFKMLLLINHPAPRHRVWNASIKWELCSIWLHLDIHHPLLRVAKASFWETHWGSSPMSLNWCKEYLRKTQASASDASIHKSSLVLSGHVFSRLFRVFSFQFLTCEKWIDDWFNYVSSCGVDRKVFFYSMDNIFFEAN